MSKTIARSLPLGGLAERTGHFCKDYMVGTLSTTSLTFPGEWDAVEGVPTGFDGAIIALGPCGPLTLAIPPSSKVFNLRTRSFAPKSDFSASHLSASNSPCECIHAICAFFAAKENQPMPG